MSRARAIQERRRAALVICANTPREAARDLLDMLGLIPIEPSKYTGTSWFDTGYDGGRKAHNAKKLQRSTS